MNDCKLISIIVPVYKTVKYLERCVSSLLSQTYDNLQVILVNDGSPDASSSICEKLRQWDRRVTVINKENGGISSARNAGLDAAIGEYIIFTDSDDYVLPEFVQTLYTTITQCDADIAECGYIIEKASNGVKSYRPPNFLITEGSTSICELFCRDSGINDFLWNKIFRRSLWDGVRLTSLACGEDFEVLCRILPKVSRVAATEECLYIYFRHDGCIGTSAFSEKKLDVMRSREIAYDSFISSGMETAAALCAMRLLSCCFTLYNQAEKEKDKKFISDKFGEYLPKSRGVPDSFVKRIYRKVKFGMFRLAPSFAVKLFR